MRCPFVIVLLLVIVFCSRHWRRLCESAPSCGRLEVRPCLWYVKMAVRPSLPVEEVSIILGNDLAGERVVSCPGVSSSPCESSETD